MDLVLEVVKTKGHFSKLSKTDLKFKNKCMKVYEIQPKNYFLINKCSMTF